jgi:hypothetical protein
MNEMSKDMIVNIESNMDNSMEANKRLRSDKSILMNDNDIDNKRTVVSKTKMANNSER